MQLKFQNPSVFSKELQRQGVDWISRQPSGRYANGLQWAWSLMFLVGLVVSYFFLMSTQLGFLSIIYCVLIGVFLYITLGVFSHDAAHGSLHRKKWINNLALYLGFALVGVHGPLWKYRHLKKHHPFPNVHGSDVDADGSNIIRLSPHTEHKVWHKLQFLYAPILYGVVLTHVAWIEDWFHWKKAAQDNPLQFNNKRMCVSFFMAKIIHLTVFVLIPYFFLSPTLLQLLLGYMIVTVITSWLFVIVNVGSHITDVCNFPKPNELGVIPSDWATHQWYHQWIGLHKIN